MTTSIKALAYPSKLWLAQPLQGVLQELVELAHETQELVKDEHRLPDNFGSRRSDLLHKLRDPSLENRNSSLALRFAYLHPLVCEMLREELAPLTFQPNDIEDAAFQMDELVLRKHHPHLYESLKTLHDMVLQPLWVVWAGLYPDEVNSIQAAKYHPDERGMTNWHYDQSSGCTTTVVLSKDDQYKGGGMQVFPGIDLGPGFEGMACMFKGRTLLHRSNPVTEGERLMLVHWVDHR